VQNQKITAQGEIDIGRLMADNAKREMERGKMIEQYGTVWLQQLSQQERELTQQLHTMEGESLLPDQAPHEPSYVPAAPEEKEKD